jgi:hypothetical protein
VTARRSDLLSLLLLALLYAVSRFSHLYTVGFPDGDQMHTALGILDAVQTGAWFLGTRIYALAVSPGYYGLLFLLSPLYRAHPATLIPLMSALGAVAGLGAQIFLWLWVRDRWGAAPAWLVSLLWLFAPGWWELTTFGHPSVLAVCAALAALFAFSRGARLAACICFAIAVLLRADLILAGGVFPALAWLSSRRFRSVFAGVIVPVAAFVLWAVAMRAIHPPAPAEHGGGTVSRFFDVLETSRSVYVKELVILVLGIGPVTALVAGGAWIFGLAGRRVDALVIALALGLPALVWWLHVEGPFRHMLIVALALLIPATLLVERRPVAVAVAFGLAVALANLIAMHAVRDRLLASYPWTYRPVGRMARWSTRAPLDDWFSNHAASEKGVRAEAGWARAFARSPEDSLVVVTPLPFRYEFEILERGEPHRYRARLDSTVIWTELVSGESIYRFVEGNPGPTQRALDRAAAEGKLQGFAIWVPPDAIPTEGFSLPAGMRRADLP